jgi:trimeric autotransporter adhesin
MFNVRFTAARKILLGSAVLCLVLLPNLHAQIRSATITGLVTDPSGAVIPDATVVVTETATSVSYPSKSDNKGLFTVPYLEAGDYTVTITKEGFKKSTINRLHIDSAQTVRQDVKLIIGATNVQVEVDASAQQINTEDGTLAGITPASVIDVIPNVTNNPFQYAQLQNGVIPSAVTQSTTNPTQSFGVGVTGRTDFAAFSVNGAQAGENNIMLDGLPIMGGGYNDPTIIPNLEGISTVQVLANAYSSEYGRGSGQLSITSKSGSNKFHGLVSYENRNEALMANTAANKAVGTRRPAFKVNNIGGEVDGPILKDRLFFTSSFHYLSHNYGSPELLKVPTALERTGDFGSTYVAGTTGQPVPIQVFNPFSVSTINPNLYQRSEFPTSTNCSSNPFGSYGCGDKIANPNAIGLTLLSQYPLPNAAPIDAYETNNYVTSIKNTISQYSNNNRVDYKRGRHSIYGTGGLQWDTINNPNVFGAGNVQGFNDVGLVTFDRNYYAQVGDTVVFSPTLIMDVRYGATRDHTGALGGRTSGFTNYSGFGIAAATQALFAEQGSAPVVNPGTWSNLTPDAQFANKQEHQINHSANGSVTKIKGSWSFKAGGQFQVILHNYNDFEEASTNLGGCCASDQSQASYSAQYVSATGAAQNAAPYNTTPQLQGFAGAQTLVGEGVWFVRPGANLKPAYASKYFALYSQNDWKVSRKLTLNLGVRWEVQPAIAERYNRMAGYDFSKPNPLFPSTMGAIDFPGTNGYGHGLWDTEWNNWSPHLGFAYRLRSNLVARGGFSINYLPSNTGFYSSPNDYGEATWASGNSGSQTYGASPAGIPTERITDAAPIIAATGSNVLAPQTYGVAEAYFPRNFKVATNDQFNFTMETSFGRKAEWLFSTGYAGSRENHLFTRNLPFENIQSISASAPGTLASWRQTYISSSGATQPQTTLVTNPYQPTSGSLSPLQNQLAAATIQQFIPYLPYPLLYASGAGLDGSTGFASYDSLQTHLSHRTTALYLDVNYTWSKSLGFVQSIVGGGNISSGVDLLCNRCNRNYESQDTPHRLIVTAIYQSPFSHGQRWDSNRVVSAVLGGWSLSPVFLAQDGNPITLSGLSGQFTGRINYAGSGKGSVPLSLPKSYQHWYDGKTKVTLPCGLIVTPGVNTKLKYNLCAFSGPTVTSPTGVVLADEYWYGNGNQTNGNVRGPSRVNVDLSLRRTFKLTERFKLDITAASTNLMNSAEWSSSQSGTIGSTDTVNNPANGQIVGLSQSGGYGTANKTTYDPRQVELVGRIVF